jgi:S-adenosylmethionine synthetase
MFEEELFVWYSLRLHEQSADINQGVDRSSPEERYTYAQGTTFGCNQ